MCIEFMVNLLNWQNNYHIIIQLIPKIYKMEHFEKSIYTPCIIHPAHLWVIYYNISTSPKIILTVHCSIVVSIRPATKHHIPMLYNVSHGSFLGTREANYIILTFWSQRWQ